MQVKNMKNQIEQLYSYYLTHPEICTDTRKIKKGSLFFALRGESFNGNKFAEQAIEEGCALAIIDEEVPEVGNKKTSYMRVPNVLKALQDLAQYHREQLKIPVIAITGSNGKTTTKELVKAVLSKQYFTYATIGNLNNHIGVPLTLLSITKQHQMAIIEMGANHIGEIASLCKISQPDFGIITNIGKAHLEGFGGVQGVINAKNELYAFIRQNKGLLFVNSDNNLLLDLSKGINKITYGTSQDSNCQGKIIDVDPFIKMKYKTATGNDHVEVNDIINSHLPGKYNFENILAAICIGHRFKVDTEKIKEGIENYIPANNRSEIIQKATNTIWLDAYNANPTSMEAAIENFSELKASSKILILGDMLELGQESKKEHQHLVSLIKKEVFTHILFVGNCFSETHNNINAVVFRNVDEALPWLNLNKFINSTILLKGSRGIKLEKLVEVL